jgi:murein DD-endopeptidase MepM/ murein hydrolase activator NlpD
VGHDAESRNQARVGQLAAEFESMLLLQMLREMRAAGSWKVEGDDEGVGAEPLFDALDTELASHLASQRGFGLAKVLSPGLEPLVSGSGSSPSVSPVRPQPVPISLPELVDTAPAEPEPSVATVTSAYGWRRDPFNGATVFHRGVDVRAAYGEPVRAAAPGRVVFAGDQGGYGNTVVVEHADGLRTRYAHLSAVQVTAGESVDGGAPIGRAGRSGRATGTHLHFEVTRHGRAVDPAEVGLTPLKPEAQRADLAGATVTRPGSPS